LTVRRAAYLAVAALLLACGNGAWAHDGVEHGAVMETGRQARFERRPDGTTVVPKAVQDSLGFKSVAVVSTTAVTTLSLPGRVVANPASQARVQTPRDGRVTATSPLPVVGQRVAAGDVLMTLEPVFSAVDENTLAQQLLTVERELALLGPRAEHIGQVNPLMPMGDATVQLMQEMQIQSDSLGRQRQQIRDLLSKPIEVKAPIAGVIGTSGLLPGQIVQARDVLFEIVGTGPARIEAWGFQLPAPLKAATLAGNNGAPVALRVIGQSPVLQQRATVLTLETTAPLALPIGMPVQVGFEAGPPRQGYLVVNDAVVRMPDGSSTVWEQTGPETFIARTVTVIPDKPGHVLVQGDLRDGARVLVAGGAALAFAP
jgi:biotin carboxyl carrier protein